MIKSIADILIYCRSYKLILWKRHIWKNIFQTFFEKVSRFALTFASTLDFFNIAIAILSNHFKIVNDNHKDSKFSVRNFLLDQSIRHTELPTFNPCDEYINLII